MADMPTSIAPAPNDTSNDKTNSLLTALLTTRRRFNGGKPRGKYGNSCFVCGKSNCWSTNRSKGENLAALRKNRRLRALISEGEPDEQELVDDDEEPDAFSIELDGLLQLLEDVGDDTPAPEACFPSTSHPCA